MDKKSIHRRFVIVAASFVLFGVFIVPVYAQTQTVESLENLSRQFGEAAKGKCGERGEAVRIGRLIAEKYAADKLNKDLVSFVRIKTAEIEKEEKECKSANLLAELYAEFRVKKPCGERSEEIRKGRQILEYFADDTANRRVIEYVKKRVEIMEKEEPVCRRDKDYNEAFRWKSTPRSFAAGKAIVDAEGDTPKALDVMIDLVSLGYNLTAYEDDDTYEVETANYAIRAIELIESGVGTTGCWGVFNCYRSKDKALGWLNYIVGFVSYFRLDGDKKALPYFYHATKYKMEFASDAFIYQAVAKYYFEKQSSLASGLSINAFVTRAQNIENRMIGMGNNFTNESEDDVEVAMLYKQLVNLYNLRYNLEENENVADLGAYIQILLDRPLIEPSKNKGKTNK